MKKTKKGLLFTALLAGCLFAMNGCKKIDLDADQKADTDEAVVQSESTAETEDAATKETVDSVRESADPAAETEAEVDPDMQVKNDSQNQETVDDSEWKNTYRDYITALDDSEIPEDTKYALIYLDDNDVPELFISTGVEAGGEKVATYADGTVTDLQLSRLGTMYIERSGKLYTDTGHMDYYPVTITQLEDGKFSTIGEGMKTGSFGDNDEYVLSYEWEGEAVSEDEFNQKVSELFDVDSGVFPDACYSADAMLEILQDN